MRTLLIFALCIFVLTELVVETESLPFVFRYFASGPDNPLAKKKKANPACKKPTPKPSIVERTELHQEPVDDDEQADDNAALHISAPANTDELPQL